MPTSVFDFVAKRHTNTNSPSKHRCGYAGVHRLSNCASLNVCDFAPRMPISSEIDKPGFPLMLCVSRKRYPFKILRKIIQFVAVNVVYGKQWIESIAKCGSHKSVQKEFQSLRRYRYGNVIVAIIANPRGKDFPLSKLAVWGALSKAFGYAVQCSDAPKIADFQVVRCKGRFSPNLLALQLCVHRNIRHDAKRKVLRTCKKI